MSHRVEFPAIRIPADRVFVALLPEVIYRIFKMLSQNKIFEIFLTFET